MKKIFTFLLMISLLCITNLSWGALSKSVGAVDEWAEIAQNAVREGATTDVSTYYQATLHIAYGLSSEVAHTGTKISVQGSSTTSGDEDWYTIAEFTTKTGTPNTEAFGGSEAGGATVLEVASTTGLYDDDETRWIFIEDNTAANSEIALLVSHVANVSVTVQDGITNAHDTSDAMFDIADSLSISIPDTVNRVRIIYDNTYDSDGATLFTYCRISGITGI